MLHCVTGKPLAVPRWLVETPYRLAPIHYTT